MEDEFKMKQSVLGIAKSPSETRPINCIGSKLKGMLAISLNQSASISSLSYCKVHGRLISGIVQAMTTFSKYKGIQVMKL